MRFGARILPVAIIAFLVLVLAGGACRFGDKYEPFDSASPLERSQAAIRAGESGDFRVVPKLVDLLEDRDGAVRMCAIQSLRRLCGEDFGYRHYGPEEERTRAVQRWRAALRAGTLKPAPLSSQPVSAPRDAGGGPEVEAASGRLRHGGLEPGQ